MNSQPAETREELADDITPEQIQQLIAEEEQEGATNCEVVTENGKRFIVCQWPLGGQGGQGGKGGKGGKGGGVNIGGGAEEW